MQQSEDEQDDQKKDTLQQTEDEQDDQKKEAGMGDVSEELSENLNEGSGLAGHPLNDFDPSNLVGERESDDEDEDWKAWEKEQRQKGGPNRRDSDGERR